MAGNAANGRTGGMIRMLGEIEPFVNTGARPQKIRSMRRFLPAEIGPGTEPGCRKPGWKRCSLRPHIRKDRLDFSDHL